MRIITCIALLIFGFGCAGTNNKSDKLNGTWVPVTQEMGGTALPNAAFEKQTLVISDSNYTLTAESVDKGVVRCSDDKMDIYGKDGVNAGKHFTAIYKIENGQLTICYNLAGDNYPKTFETKGQPMYFLSVFKKN
jgi:uncharacterized protein (TIGR03067 family)